MKLLNAYLISQFQFIGSNLFNWVGGNVQDNRFLGIGGEGECTCAKSQQCGGNVSEAILRTRSVVYLITTFMSNL